MSHINFKLEQLFGSKTRARLLQLFLEQPEKAFFVRELTRKIDAQLNSVRRELKNLMELGVVVERIAEDHKVSRLLADRKRFYAANAGNILYDDLRALFKKVHILMRQNLVQELENQGDIHYFAFTGRFIDLKDIPTDIIIVGNIDAAKVQQVMKSFEEDLGAEINYTLMPKDEFMYRRQVTDRFLTSLLESQKVVVVNRLGI